MSRPLSRRSTTLTISGARVRMDASTARWIRTARPGCIYVGNNARGRLYVCVCLNRRRDGECRTTLARLLLGIEPGEHRAVRYRNNNPLDVRRENLRVIDPWGPGKSPRGRYAR